MSSHSFYRRVGTVITTATYSLEVRWNATALAADGDMEAVGTASYTATNCTLAKDTVTFFAGAKSLQGTNTLANGYASQSGSLAAGKVVTVSVRARGGDAATKLEVYSTPSNTLLGSHTNPDTTNWNPLRVTGTIPGADTGYQVRLVNGSGATIVARWDELEIEDWTDETTNMLSVEWSRGRDYASQLTGQASAGTLSARLQNVSGRYAPLNTAGALFGSLLPGRKIRIRTTAPIAATLWQGFLSEIAPDPGSRGAAPTARLVAKGPLEFLADKKASTAVYTSILGGTAVGHILTDAAWPVADRTLDVGQITMTRWKADGDLSVSHLREIEETELAYVGESKDGKVVFEDSQHRLAPPHTVSQATFSDASGASLPYEAITELDPWREIYNHFSAEVITFATQALAVLWSLMGETPSISAAATKDFWAVYPNPDSPTQADQVDAWTTPAATTDYTANTQADGLGTDKTAAITVAVSKFANSMKISLTNTDAGTVFITFLQARGTAVYRNDPIRVVKEDATSQTKFGKRSYPLPGMFYPSTTVATSYVELGLSRYKDQLAVVSITYQANQSDAHMTQALTRDVSDRISLVAQGTGASGAQLGINHDFFIEAEHHRLDLSGHWVTYDLSDARFDAGYWLLGTGQLGSTTKLAA